VDHPDRYARERNDEDGYRGERHRRYDRDSRPEQEREESYRHGSLGIGTGDLDVRIDVGGWLARG
jgi:hypothetical protein